MSTTGLVRNKNTNKILKQNVRKQDGFAQVTLYAEGVRRTIKIHRIMLETFMNITDQEMKVIHIDGNKSNNSINNLKIQNTGELVEIVDTTSVNTYDIEPVEISDPNFVKTLEMKFNDYTLIQQIENIDNEIEKYNVAILKLKNKRIQLTQELNKNIDHTVEIWRPIKDFPGYEASNFGQIKSNKTNKILSQQKTDAGYLQCTLYNTSGGRSSYLVHRLIAQTFLEDWDSNLSVDHIDYNPENNNVINLRMLSFKENTKRKRNTYKPVNQYTLDGNFLQQFESCEIAAYHLNCNAHNIKNCARGKQLTSGGYKWKYADVD